MTAIPETTRVGPVDAERLKLADLASRRSNAATAVAGHGALIDAGFLRGSNYGDVSVAAWHGTATLRGHVANSTDKLRAGRSMRDVPGVSEVQNDLVTDDDLVNLVAQALAHDERTRRETIFVAVSHGVVILSGQRNSAKARAAAEECAARVSSVRGVSNYIEAPGIVVSENEQHVLQPRAGQEVLASDMALGRVKRVIVDPHNRRVAAIVVVGRFPDRRRATPRMRSYDMPMEERCLVIPIAEVRFMTRTVVQLTISGIAAARHDDLSPGNFAQPDPTWRPPYPFAADECLWAVP